MGIWTKRKVYKEKDYRGVETERVEKEPNIPGIIGSVVAFILIIVLLFICFTTVPTGYTGILTTFGRVEDVTMNAGVHIIAPWQRVIKLDNRTQKVELTTQTFSSDIQQVDLKMSVNYCIDQTTAQNLYSLPTAQIFLSPDCIAGFQSIPKLHYINCLV